MAVIGAMANTATREAAYIHIANVTFAYPGADQPVLREASLVARKGGVTCLMGVNGCGKSTLIDCILGENQIESGSIAIDGQDASAFGPEALAKRVSFVPQVHERTFPYKVRDIVLMGRTAHFGLLESPGDDDRALVNDALRECGIAHLAERPYTQLSGGETQMVLLARALAQQAPFVIMDEPTAHLDFKNELLFMETIVRLVKEQGVGVLIATHSPNQAFYFEGKSVPTTCALMDAGRVQHIGLPSDVLTPGNLQDLYGICAQVVDVDTGGGNMAKQLVLVSTEKDSNGALGW